MKLNAVNAFSARIIIIVSVVMRAEGFQRIYGLCLAVNYALLGFDSLYDTDTLPQCCARSSVRNTFINIIFT